MTKYTSVRLGLSSNPSETASVNPSLHYTNHKHRLPSESIFSVYSTLRKSVLGMGGWGGLGRFDKHQTMTQDGAMFRVASYL